MRPALPLVVVLLSFVAFSGCMQDHASVQLERVAVPVVEDDADADEWTPSYPTTPPSTATTVPLPPDNDSGPELPDLPEANLTVDRDNGSVPFEPVFTIRDRQAVGGSYNWSIDFGDGNITNGTDVPVALSHTYYDVGVYIVNITLGNAGGNTTASVNVTARDFAAERHQGAWENGASACAAGTQASWTFSDLNETTHVEFPISNATWGMPFLVAFDAEDASEWKVDFYNDDGDLVNSQAASEDPVVNGTVPEHAALVVLWACDDGGGGSAEYVAATQEEWERQRDPPNEAQESSDDDP